MNPFNLDLFKGYTDKNPVTVTLDEAVRLITADNALHTELPPLCLRAAKQQCRPTRKGVHALYGSSRAFQWRKAEDEHHGMDRPVAGGHRPRGGAGSPCRAGEDTHRCTYLAGLRHHQRERRAHPVPLAAGGRKCHG